MQELQITNAQQRTEIGEINKLPEKTGFNYIMRCNGHCTVNTTTQVKRRMPGTKKEKVKNYKSVFMCS